MARKKMKEGDISIDDFNDREVIDEIDKDLFDFEDNQPNKNNSNNDFADDNMATNPMEYASIVAMPSKSAKHFEHVPREVRYGFLKDEEAREIKHWDKNYRNYKYLKKVLLLQAQEDIHIIEKRLTLYSLKDEEDFNQYCKDTNNLIAYNNIKNKPEVIKEIIEHVSQLQKNGFYDDIKNQSDLITNIYNVYRQENEKASFVDDLGMAGNIFGTAVVSMGRDGKLSEHSVMTIQATKDIDIKKDQENKTEYKDKLGKFFNKWK